MGDVERIDWQNGIRDRAVAAARDNQGAVNAGVQSEAEKARWNGWIEGHMTAQQEMVWPLMEQLHQVRGQLVRIVEITPTCGQYLPNTCAGCMALDALRLIDAKTKGDPTR